MAPPYLNSLCQGREKTKNYTHKYITINYYLSCIYLDWFQQKLFKFLKFITKMYIIFKGVIQHDQYDKYKYEH